MRAPHGARTLSMPEGYSGIAASRRRIAAFELVRPDSLDALCDALADAPLATALHAGGIDLVNRMKAGYAPQRVVALGRVRMLHDVRLLDDRVEIGAAATHWQVEHDATLRAHLPELPAYVAGLGNVRVRAQGSIGGNVMAREPGYEMLPMLGVLGAELHCFNGVDRAWTRCQANDRLTWGGKGSASLLTAISIPRRQRSIAWDRQLRPGLGLVMALDWDGDAVRSGTAAVIGDGAGPIFGELPEALAAKSADAAANCADIAAQWARAFPDIRTPAGPSVDYCRQVLPVLLRRTLERCLA